VWTSNHVASLGSEKEGPSSRILSGKVFRQKCKGKIKLRLLRAASLSGCKKAGSKCFNPERFRERITCWKSRLEIRKGERQFHQKKRGKRTGLIRKLG